MMAEVNRKVTLMVILSEEESDMLQDILYTFDNFVPDAEASNLISRKSGDKLCDFARTLYLQLLGEDEE